MHGLDVETTALSPDDGRLRLVQISDGRRARVFDLYQDDEDTVRAALAEHDDFVAHNAVFERKWIKAALGVDIGVIDDTMIMSQVLYTGTRAAMRRNFSHSLASVVNRELKIEMSKERSKRVIVTPWSSRRPKRALRRLCYSGASIRPAKRAETLKAELTEEWGINPGSGKQLIEHFGLADRTAWPTTPAGAPSTNQDAMRALVDEYPEVSKWVEWKEVEKIRSTYGNSLRKRLTPGRRIHARFNPFGTATSRFSSSGPNLQNIPKRGAFGKRMRGLFWSGSYDRVLIKADYASIELWVAAVLWDEPHMQKALQQGVNMHVATAAALFNVKPEEVTKEQNSQTQHERFAGLERALKAPLRDMANSPCWGVVGQGCGFKVFKGAAGKDR